MQSGIHNSLVENLREESIFHHHIKNRSPSPRAFISHISLSQPLSVSTFRTVTTTTTTATKTNKTSYPCFPSFHKVGSSPQMQLQKNNLKMNVRCGSFRKLPAQDNAVMESSVTMITVTDDMSASASCLFMECIASGSLQVLSYK